MTAPKSIFPQAYILKEAAVQSLMILVRTALNRKLAARPVEGASNDEDNSGHSPHNN